MTTRTADVSCVLFGVAQVSYTEPTGENADIRVLEAATYGNIPNVHAWRNEVKAL